MFMGSLAQFVRKGSRTWQQVGKGERFDSDKTASLPIDISSHPPSGSPRLPELLPCLLEDLGIDGWDQLRGRSPKNSRGRPK